MLVRPDGPSSLDGGYDYDAAQPGNPADLRGTDGSTPFGPDGSHPGGPDGSSPSLPDLSSPDAEIGLTFSGCSPTFSDIRVVTNIVSYDSIGVVNGFAPLSGDVTTALKTATPRTVVLSSTQRSQSMNDVVLNVSAGGVTYTNFCFSGTLGCTYNAGTSSWNNDPISGSFVINDYDPQNGKLDVVFNSVVLQDVSSSALCTVNGTLKTHRLSQ